MTQNLEEFDIHIASDGRWFHQGGEIKRPAIIKLFASVLSRDDNGRYWLTTPVEKGEVTVEDAPFIIIGLKSIHDVGEENPRLEMVDNVDRDFILGSYHPVFFKKKPHWVLLRDILAFMNLIQEFQFLALIIA